MLLTSFAIFNAIALKLLPNLSLEVLSQSDYQRLSQEKNAAKWKNHQHGSFYSK